jgi:hypothetical protein
MAASPPSGEEAKMSIGGASVGGNVGTDGGDFTGRDSIVHSDQGRQDNQTVSTVIVSGAETILQTILYQLNRVENKLDNHVQSVDLRFRSLENATVSVDQRLRLIEKTIVDLEHTSEKRERQTAELEQQMNAVKTQLNNMQMQLDEARNDLSNVHNSIKTEQKERAEEKSAREKVQRDNEAKVHNRSSVIFYILITTLVSILSFVSGLGVFFYERND